MHISFYCHSSSLEALDMRLQFIAMGFEKSQQWLLLYKHIHCVIILISRQPKWIVMAFDVPLSLLRFWNSSCLYSLWEEKKKKEKSGKFYSLGIFYYDDLFSWISEYQQQAGPHSTKTVSALESLPLRSRDRPDGRGKNCATEQRQQAIHIHSVSSNYFLIFKWIFPLVLKGKWASNMR